jgi:hypothetical protein
MLKLSSSSKAIGTPVRCPACRHSNLAIDIWCERCGRPLDSKPTQPVPSEAPPAPNPVDFCPNCGAPSFVAERYCPRCGSSMSASPGPPPARPGSQGPRRRGRLRMPRVQLPALTIPKFSIPRVAFPVLRLPRPPGIVGVVLAVLAALALLLIVPLVYARLSVGHSVATRSQLPSTVGTASSPKAAAIPGVEAKTGLRLAANCSTNAPCLSFVSQITGTNAAAVIFSTARSGGRECASYVYRLGASWRGLDAVCGLPGQLSPLVGHDATVHVPNSCANVRSAAGLRARVVACVYDGTVVHVDGGPTYADGRLWWQLKSGWMAHDFLVGP